MAVCNLVDRSCLFMPTVLQRFLEMPGYFNDYWKSLVKQLLKFSVISLSQ